jgi:murein DD-endopeptidase MepM/ murein hydrolase activator NlpD
VRHLISVREAGVALGATALFALLGLVLVAADRCAPPAALASVPDGFVFPVQPTAEIAGVSPECTLTDSFGDPRPGGRSHEGVDILAAKLQPVVAAADGRVQWMMDEREGRCCHLALEHEDGWRTRYLHLNNDSPGSDDGRVVGVAPWLELGAEVAAGEVIGWVGDSGNAERTGPHLHFELLDPDGEPVDPYPLLEILEGAC